MHTGQWEDKVLGKAKFGAGLTFIAAIGVTVLALAISARAADADMARGQYLVTISGCNDCHTPGYFLGKPDMNRFLGGSDVGFEIPGLGVFLGRNLTPDKETGIGTWTTEQIVTALQSGVRPDGRMLAPIMPYHAFAHLTKEDATAIADYLKTIKPVQHAVPGPFGPGETVPTFIMRIIPPGATAAAAPK
jgi:mono/diheme cytochrome c family protein